MHGRDLDGLVCRALAWNFTSTQGPCFIEYPASLQGLPDWIEHSGGFAAISKPQRLGLLATVCERVASMHRRNTHLGRLNPAAVLVGTAGPREPMIYLPAAMYGVDTLSPRLYTRICCGHEELYVAPELRRGANATPAADSYSIGLILFQLMAADWTLLPTPGWELRVRSAPIRALIARCVNFDPAARPHRLVELGAELRHCASTMAVSCTQGAPTAALS